MDFRFVFALLVAALLLGCAGSQPATQQPAATPPAQTPASPAATQPAQPAGSSGSTPQAPAEQPSGTPAQTTPAATEPAAVSATSAFEAIAAMVKNSEYKAEYTTTVTAQGQTTTMDTMEELKGTKMRIDTTVMGQVSSTYVIDGTAYMCTTTGGTAVCYSATAPASDASQEVTANPAKYTITALPGRTIANIAASCFGIAGADFEGEMETCYSAEGILLYLHYTSAQSGEMLKTATSVQVGSVDPADFTLPATPMQLPSTTGYGGY
ncbi:Uncharacterised protein [Candidatus Burarchaeum australiense]|nr:Uncharacterised protein [Candidatus Burarchaeum australiense]